MSNNSGIGNISEYEYFLGIVGGTMPTCPRETQKSPKKRTAIRDYNAFEHSITTQINDIQTLTELIAPQAPTDQGPPLDDSIIEPPPAVIAESVETAPQIPTDQGASLDDSIIEEPPAGRTESLETIAPQAPTDQGPPLDDSIIECPPERTEFVEIIAPQTLNSVPAPEEKLNGIEAETDTNTKISSEQLPQEEKTEELTLKQASVKEEKPNGIEGETDTNAKTSPVQLPQKENTEEVIPKQPKIAEPVKPLPKGSFTAKFANTFSKELVFVVENLGYVDRTLNESFKLAGYDYAVNMNSYTYTRGFMHSVLSIIDAFTTEKYQYLPIFSTAAFNVNLHSRILNDHHPLIQCALETVYGSLKNILDNSFPTTFALSTAINITSCFNRELNEHSSKKHIASVLNTVRSMLYFQSPSGFIKLATLVLRTGWDIKDMYDLYNTLLDSKEDLLVEMNTGTRTDAALNTLNYEADTIIHVTSDTSLEAISHTIGNINSTEIPIF